jgi:hypothetical protein
MYMRYRALQVFRQKLLKASGEGFKVGASVEAEQFDTHENPCAALHDYYRGKRPWGAGRSRVRTLTRRHWPDNITHARINP